jgi:archaellum component FlaG (FlaF/FlaG flagellin family)
MSRVMSRFAGTLFSALLAAALCGCGAPDGRSVPGPGGILHIATVPDDAVVALNGEARGSSPLILEDLPAGTYLLTASREDCNEARRTVTLSAGETEAIEMHLAPLTGLVLVHSSPPGASVTVGDEVRGTTPLLLQDLPYGRNPAQVELEGYQTEDVSIDVTDRRPVKLDLVMVKDTASLSITSEPDGASVVINGTPYGDTPCQFDGLSKGTALIRIRKPGFMDYERSMDLRAGETYSIRAQLERIPGTLEVVALPEGARVYVDDRLMGEAPVAVERLESGPHTVRVELRGHATQTREVTVDGTNAAREEFTLVPNSGSLIVATRPPGVQVYVDGSYRGVTEGAAGATTSEPLVLEYLPPGTRALQLSKRGYEGVPKAVVILPGGETEVREVLRPLFAPDTKIRTRSGAIHRGVLVEQTDRGDIRLEVRRGAFMEFRKNEVLEVTPIEPEGER